MTARSMSPFAKAAFLLAAPAIALGACSSASEQVGKIIKPKVQEALGGAEVTVTCPKDAKAAKGETFSCDATTVDGNQTLPISVTFTDDRHFTFEQGAAFFTTTDLNNTIKTALSTSDTPVDNVSCGSGKFVIKKPNEQIECTITAGGETKTLKATVTDVKGNIDTSSITVS